MAGPVADLWFEVRCVPDSASHWVESPAPASRLIYEPTGGTVVYDPGSERLHVLNGDHLRLLCLPAQGRTQVSVVAAEADRLAPLLAGPILTLALIEQLKRRGLYSLHAAGVCEGRALLLAGPSGCGKSTLALTLAGSGFGFLSDDLVFLSTGGGQLRVLAFPDRVDLDSQAAARFPDLASKWEWEAAAVSSKLRLRPSDVPGLQVQWECTPASIVFPRVTHQRRSRLRALDGAAALVELAPNVLLTEAGSSQAHLDVLAGLARSLPCYRLEVGLDLAALAPLLRTILS